MFIEQHEHAHFVNIWLSEIAYKIPIQKWLQCRDRKTSINKLDLTERLSYTDERNIS